MNTKKFLIRIDLTNKSNKIDKISTSVWELLIANDEKMDLEIVKRI